jgi:hypothetical protein
MFIIHMSFGKFIALLESKVIGLKMMPEAGHFRFQPIEVACPEM